MWLNAWLTRTEVSGLCFCAYVHVWEEYQTRIITNFSDSLRKITDEKKLQASTISVLCLKQGFFLLFLLSHSKIFLLSTSKHYKHSHNRESNSETSAKNSHSNHNKRKRCNELDVEKLTVAGDPQEQEDPRDHDWGRWRGWNLQENSGRVWNRSWQAQTCTKMRQCSSVCCRGRMLRSLSAVSFTRGRMGVCLQPPPLCLPVTLLSCQWSALGRGDGFGHFLCFCFSSLSTLTLPLSLARLLIAHPFWISSLAPSSSFSSLSLMHSLTIALLLTQWGNGAPQPDSSLTLSLFCSLPPLSESRSLCVSGWLGVLTLGKRNRGCSPIRMRMGATRPTSNGQKVWIHPSSQFRPCYFVGFCGWQRI